MAPRGMSIKRTMRRRVERIIGEEGADEFIPPETTMEEITILIEDVTVLTKEIHDLVDNGVTWSEDRVGAEREEFIRWRLELMKTKKKAVERTKNKEKEDEDQRNLMAKQVQPRKIPTITKGNWPMFLFVTITEFKKYSEEQKVSLLRNKTVDPIDKNNILAM